MKIILSAFAIRQLFNGRQLLKKLGQPNIAGREKAAREMGIEGRRTIHAVIDLLRQIESNVDVTLNVEEKLDL